ENGIVPFYYANGVRRQQGTSALWVSHAWLYRDGLIVDITADQFPEVVSKVIVTTDSPWHRTFDVTIEHIADCRIYDERATTRLERMYRKIVSKIETA